MTIALLVLLLQTPQRSPPQSPAAAVSQNPDYLVGPQDKLSITVVGIPELNQQNGLVDNAGMMTYLDQGVIKTTGKTVRQIQAEIRQLLIDKGQATNPTVQVEVSAFRPQMVYVSGAVGHPQGYPITGTETLMQVLAQAGFSPAAGQRVQVARNRPTHQEFTFDRHALENGTAAPFFLQDGDTVIVPDAEKAIVRGDVRSPGMYEVGPDTTLLQLLVIAGDFTDKAARGSVKVTRKNDTGKPVDQKVGHEQYSTFLVKPGDVVFVGRRIL